MFMQDEDEEYSDPLEEDEEEDEYDAEVREEAKAGAVCSSCGTEFETAHGFPVLCRDCWAAASDKEREGMKEATHPEVV